MNGNECCIYTERLVIRRIRFSDAREMYEYRADRSVQKYQTWEPRSLADVERFITENEASEFGLKDTWHQLGVFIKESGKMIGDIGIHFKGELNTEAEIGYTISPAYQGKGYATEAVSAVITCLFAKMGKRRITASVDPMNLRSVNLLERIGMRKEAHFRKSFLFRGEWVDDVVYGLLKEEWVR